MQRIWTIPICSFSIGFLINSTFLGSLMKNCFGIPAKDFDIFNLQTDQSDAGGSGEAVTKLGSSASTEFISHDRGRNKFALTK